MITSPSCRSAAVSFVPRNVRGQATCLYPFTPDLARTSKDPKFKFRSCGQSGIQISDLLPNLQTCADEMCFIRTLHTDQFNHAPAQMFMQTGFERFGRPSLGPGQLRAWVHEQGPARFRGHGDRTIPRSRQQHFRERVPAFRLPGHRVSGKGGSRSFPLQPQGVDSAARKRVVDAINDLNREQLHGVGDPEIATRISQYEMAYRMQSSVPELKDLSTETSATLELMAQSGRFGFFQQLPACPPDGRAWRALRPVV